MLFTTPLFLFVFLPVFMVAYCAAPRAFKNAIALVGSVLFFAWGAPIFVFTLLFTTYLDYRISLFIEPKTQRSDRVRRVALVLGLAYNVSILLWSKYTGFFVEDVLAPIGLQVRNPHIALILGISFITFHKISFLVDSYKGRAVPPRNYVDCALYIFLFPQLIAGPIIRYHDIGAQVHERPSDAGDIVIGMMRFGIGFAKKILIADPLGGVTDKIFSYPSTSLPASYAWIAIIAYTLQIYFDFSGYSDMAIGLGRMMGFRFPENFNRPYTAKSIGDFWQRWHISLSRWMRIYLYIPLGGNQVSASRVYMNLWVVFLISGFWHGASWNFVAWGAFYGLFLSIERILSKSRFSRRLHPVLAQTYVLLVVVVGWVLFRSPDLHYAVGFIGVMFGMVRSAPDPSLQEWGFLVSRMDLGVALTGVLLAVLPSLPKPKTSPWLAPYSPVTDHTRASAVCFQFSVSIVLISLSSMAMLSSGYSPFIYFKF